MSQRIEDNKSSTLKRRGMLLGGTAVLAAATGVATRALAQPAQGQAPSSGRKPNILVVMGDDIGWFNIGAYHQGMMSGKTPNLDRLASEGMRFTDYYAEASCTAGRANFITGELPLRTGLTTVGQAGADVGIPDQACTLATVLKSQGYATAQFGKNHLGDLNKYLPTLHGFDEFFGYLYHLDAMSDPYWFDYPQDWIDKTGPRNLVHCWATDTDDPTDMQRWGRVANNGLRTRVRSRHSRTWLDGRTGRKAARPNTTWRRSTVYWSTTASASWMRPSGTANRFSSGTTRRACMSSPISRQSTRRR